MLKKLLSNGLHCCRTRVRNGRTQGCRPVRKHGVYGVLGLLRGEVFLCDQTIEGQEIGSMGFPIECHDLRHRNTVCKNWCHVGLA